MNMKTEGPIQQGLSVEITSQKLAWKFPHGDLGEHRDSESLLMNPYASPQAVDSRPRPERWSLVRFLIDTSACCAFLGLIIVACWNVRDNPYKAALWFSMASTLGWIRSTYWVLACYRSERICDKLESQQKLTEG